LRHPTVGVASLIGSTEPVMPLRAPTISLLVTLATACAAPRAPTVAMVRPLAGPPAPGDPERWDRAACHRGEYPLDLGDRAYAQARQRDLAAERVGEQAPAVTLRLLERRVLFQKRCEAWQQEAQQASADKADGPFTRAGWSGPPR
jgi:hypothetical protein